VGAFAIASRRDSVRARRSDIYATAAKFPNGFATAGVLVTLISSQRGYATVDDAHDLDPIAGNSARRSASGLTTTVRYVR
jgi:hypothetical protein